MKTAVLVFICLLGVLALVEFSTAQGLCDSWECSNSCLQDARHGQCDPDDICRCYNCIYSACRRLCIKQHRIGQCDETECLCL